MSWALFILPMGLTAAAPDSQSMAHVIFDISAGDAASGAPFRVHLKNAEGKSEIPAGFPFWFDHITVPGPVPIPLPPGSYRFEIEKGPAFSRHAGELELSAGEEITIQVALDQLIDLAGQGWYAGDLHVHRPPEDLPLLMRTEDIHVAPVITWWNKRNLWADQPLPDNPLRTEDRNRFYHVMAGEDERAGGAFLFFNRAAPLPIQDAAPEFPSPLEFLSKAQKDGNAWIDLEKPFWWDVPAAVAHGFGDSMGLANNHMCRSSMYESEAWGKPRDTNQLPPPRGNGYWSQEIYYDLLDSGLRVPPSAGSASGVLPNPLGYDRVYVHVDGELTHEKWWDGLRAGRSFVTNGPLLLARANGQLPGHVFKDAKTLHLELDLELYSNDPVESVEIVRNGVITKIPATTVSGKIQLEPIPFDQSGWFLIRAIANVDHTFRFGSTAPWYVDIGDTNARISRKACAFFLEWARTRANTLKLDDPAQLEAVMAWHRTAVDFWVQRMASATAP